MDTWLLVMKVFSLTLLLIIAYSAIGSFFAMLFQNPSIAILALLGFYFLMSVGLNLLAMEYTLFETIQQYSVFYYHQQIPLEIDSNNLFLWKMIGTTLGTTILFIGGGLVLFQRKDI